MCFHLFSFKHFFFPLTGLTRFLYPDSYIFFLLRILEQSSFFFELVDALHLFFFLCTLHHYNRAVTLFFFSPHLVLRGAQSLHKSLTLDFEPLYLLLTYAFAGRRRETHTHTHTRRAKVGPETQKQQERWIKHVVVLRS